MNLVRLACFTFAVATTAAVVGCSSGVLYYGDPSTTMEAKRQEYVRNNPTNRFSEDILAGRVQAGMSRLQVRIAWGEPDEVTKGDRPGIDQVWTYREDEPSRGESIFQMRFYKSVLYEVATTRGSAQLATFDSKPEITFENDNDMVGVTEKLLK